MATIITKAEEYNKEQPRPTWIGEIEKLEKRVAELETGSQKNRNNGYSVNANGTGSERNK